VNARTETDKHVDDRVRAEKMEPASKEVADAWLAYAQHLRRRGLFHAPASDRLLQLKQQIGPDQEMFGLREWELSLLKTR